MYNFIDGSFHSTIVLCLLIHWGLSGAGGGGGNYVFVVQAVIEPTTSTFTIKMYIFYDFGKHTKYALEMTRHSHACSMVILSHFMWQSPGTLKTSRRIVDSSSRKQRRLQSSQQITESPHASHKTFAEKRPKLRVDSTFTHLSY